MAIRTVDTIIKVWTQKNTHEKLLNKIVKLWNIL